MTKPRPTDPTSALEAADEETSAPVEAEAPEPWTPERVTAWNRYLDRYVAGGVLLLVLLATVHPIGHTSFWADLKAGELAAQSGPATTDVFSYTEAGKPWANVSWLYQAVLWQVYHLGQVLFRSHPERAGHAASALVISMSALVMLAAAAVLLAIRRKGPGLWWTSVCVMLALGGSVLPSADGLPVGAGGLAGQPQVDSTSWGLTVEAGGLARRAQVDSASWGLLWLSVELLLLVRAFSLGKPRALWGLPVVFLLWANTDPGFGFGLIVLVAWGLGELSGFGRARDEGPRPTLALTLGAVGACFVACLLNPSMWRAFGPAFDPYYDVLNHIFNWQKTPLTTDRLGLLDPRSRRFLSDTDQLRVETGYTLVVVGLGLVSFGLNRARFRLGRFLAFLAASVAWAGLRVMVPFFSVVMAAVVALNGQEWYLDQFGSVGRESRGWRLWSDGGRSVTILVLFGLLASTITGVAANSLEPPFGFGTDLREVAFAEAEALRDFGIKGRVFNLLLSQGDALIWKDPEHKTFLDSRKGVFPDSLRQEHQRLQDALEKGDRKTWAPMFDKYGITVVMAPPRELPKVYNALRKSPDWVPFFDGGLAVLFGRVDKKTPDQAVFLRRQLDAEKLAFGRNEPLPDPVRVPTPTGFLDRLFRSRSMGSAPPSVRAGRRWLTDPASGPPLGGNAALPSPARALLAVRNAREALAKDPDDPYAYSLLQTAYAVLQSAEAQILSDAEARDQASRPLSGPSFRRAVSPLVLDLRTPTTGPTFDPYRAMLQRFISKLLTESTQPEEVQVPARPPQQYLAFRGQQRLAALNLAVQTWPPPKSELEKGELIDLRLGLYQLYLDNQAADLARDQLRAVRSLMGKSDFPQPLQAQLDALDQRTEAFERQLDEFSAAQPQQSGPVQRADMANRNGLPGLAIEELLSAEAAGVAPASIRATLLDLYVRTGQPHKAFDLLESVSVNDPSLMTAAGWAGYRQGLVDVLLGFYSETAQFWGRHAIPQVRLDMSQKALTSARLLLSGQPAPATSLAMDVTGAGSPGLIGRQADWEAQLGLALLEEGVIFDEKDARGQLVREGAQTHLRRVLSIDESHPLKPLVEYYLGQIAKQE